LKPLHIHIENDADGPEALRLSRDRLIARLNDLSLTRTIVVTENADPASTDAAIADASIVFACRKIDLGRAKQASPGLDWVQVISAGVDGYVDHLPPGVTLTNASGVHAEKGAEFILTAVLMLNYKIPGFVTQQQRAIWEPSFGGPVATRRVTLLGVGGIGAASVPLLRALGIAVTGVTRSGTSTAPLNSCVATDRLDELLPETDVLVSTLPLTAATRGLMDRRRLALLPQGAGVVVVGRAAVFDYDALADALRSERLSGAVLDVFPKEPLPADDPLWQCPRLIITPHCSVDDHETYLDRCLDIFARNLEAYDAGRPLHNVVDPSLGY
jgi:phosphoglycerate dehydrogenase-like enzyme